MMKVFKTLDVIFFGDGAFHFFSFVLKIRVNGKRKKVYASVSLKVYVVGI